MALTDPLKAPEKSAKFFVYQHCRADCGSPFYVGKGQGKRHLSRHGRSDYWRKVATKHGYDAQIIARDLTEAEAFAAEVALIAEMRAAGVDLVNLTDGGEGMSGFSPSDASKAKMRAAKLGRQLTPEHVAKMVAANTGRACSEETKAKLRSRVRSPEQRARYRASSTGRVMAPEAVEKTAAALRGRKRSPEVVARCALNRKGAGNPNHSPVVYRFVHDEHGVLETTQNALRTTYGLQHSNLSHVVAGKRKVVKGWRCEGKVTW